MGLSRNGESVAVAKDSMEGPLLSIRMHHLNRQHASIRYTITPLRCPQDNVIRFCPGMRTKSKRMKPSIAMA